MGSKHFGIPSAYFLKYVKEQKGSTRKETNLNDEMPFQLNEKKKTIAKWPSKFECKMYVQVNVDRRRRSSRGRNRMNA